MTNREFRQHWGKSDKRTAVNAAIRAEIPGGAEAIEVVTRLQSRHAAARGNGDPAARELRYALELAQTVTDAMAAEIAKRYELPSA